VVKNGKWWKVKPKNFFFDKSKINIHSFKLIEYTRYNNMINLVKNIKDKSVNNIKSIAYNDKIPTNNMIKSKSP